VICPEACVILRCAGLVVPLSPPSSATVYEAALVQVTVMTLVPSGAAPRTPVAPKLRFPAFTEQMVALVADTLNGAVVGIAGADGGAGPDR
jgi:hypothetical protein